MTLAYFDCFSGAGGDMIVASLVDATARTPTNSNGSSPPSASAATPSPSKRSPSKASPPHASNVQLDPAEKQPHRHLKHVIAIIDGGNSRPR